MAVATSTALIAAAAVTAASTGYSLYQQNKAAGEAEAAQKKANETSSAAAQVQNARARRQAIAQARIAQAQNQAAQGEAVQSSSALSGVQSSISTQLGANIGAQRQRVGAQQDIQMLSQSAYNAIQTGRQRASLAQGIGQIGTSALFTYGRNGSVDFPDTQFGANSFASQTPGPRGAGGFR